LTLNWILTKILEQKLVLIKSGGGNGPEKPQQPVLAECQDVGANSYLLGEDKIRMSRSPFLSCD